MENEFQSQKIDIEKINLRVKEFLWSERPF